MTDSPYGDLGPRACAGTAAQARAAVVEHKVVHRPRQEALGSYGRALASALTLHQYVQQGMSLYRTLVQGQTIWLSAHDNRVRVSLWATWKPSPGDRQARMKHSDKPVVEIAFDLGYADASNFTRAFRQLTGVTPSAFRQAGAELVDRGKGRILELRRRIEAARR